MGMGFAPTWLRQVSQPPLLHKTTLTTVRFLSGSANQNVDFIILLLTIVM